LASIGSCYGSLVITKSLDYSAFNKTKQLPPQLFGLSDDHVENLFLEEFENMEREGSTNRFWNIFVNTKPFTGNFHNISATFKHTHRLSKREENQFFDTAVRNSPLSVVGRVQQGIQSSAGARLIDASSSIGLKVSEKLTNDLLGDKRFDFDPVGVLSNFQAPNSMCPFKVNLACNATSPFPPEDG
jgi:hypothetical protein